MAPPEQRPVPVKRVSFASTKNRCSFESELPPTTLVAVERLPIEDEPTVQSEVIVDQCIGSTAKKQDASTGCSKSDGKDCSQKSATTEKLQVNIHNEPVVVEQEESEKVADEGKAEDPPIVDNGKSLLRRQGAKKKAKMPANKKSKTGKLMTPLALSPQ